MNEEQLRQLAAEQAARLEIRFDKILTRPYEMGIPEREVSGYFISTDLIDGDLHLRTANLEEVPERIGELTLANNLSLLTLPEERVGRDFVVPLSYSWMQACALEVFNTYVALLQGERMIEVFGQEAYDELQAYGLEELTGKVEELLQYLVHEEACVGIAALEREYLKNGLMRDPPPMRSVLGHLTAPFRPVFRMIDETGRSWRERSTLMYLLTGNKLENSDPVASYQAGELCLRAPWNPVSSFLTTCGFLPGHLEADAIDVEETIRTAYQSLPHRQVRVD